MVAKHIGVELTLKELDFLKREHEAPEFTKIPSYRTNKKPSAESFKEFEEGVLKAFQQVIRDKTTFVACDDLTLADIRLISLLACIVPTTWPPPPPLSAGRRICRIETLRQTRCNKNNHKGRGAIA
ncbi:hypothetical protein HPB49_014045 [Dermacentor silvarum]|uniref:Uncharacterized protein n=1 Tax=Dermacentor silvarum TaxID=543639 RepID=A0ACB8D650_DERSI|nr:hypothetical protein HPB49_014045 [Dermacentor silvarum]